MDSLRLRRLCWSMLSAAIAIVSCELIVDTAAAEMRPGISQVGLGSNSDLLDINDKYAVRIILDIDQIDGILTNTTACNQFRDLLNAWRHDERCPFILTIRITSDSDSKADEVPGSQSERDDVLQSIEDFFGTWGPYIEYYQVANEFWAGVGAYRVKVGATTKQLNAWCGTDFDTAMDDVFDWFEDMAQAAIDGHASQKVIGPAIGVGMVADGYGGSWSGPYTCPGNADNRKARAIREAILFGNTYDATDIHLIVESICELEDTVDDLEDSTAGWGVTPDQLTSLEWSAADAFDRNNTTWSSTYIAPDTYCEYMCEAYDTNVTQSQWDSFTQSFWNNSQSDIGCNSPGVIYQPEDFMEDALQRMSDADFLHALRHASKQWNDGCDCSSGPLPRRFDFLAQWADETVSSTDKWTIFNEAYETATDLFTPSVIPIYAEIPSTICN